MHHGLYLTALVASVSWNKLWQLWGHYASIESTQQIVVLYLSRILKNWSSFSNGQRITWRLQQTLIVILFVEDPRPISNFCPIMRKMSKDIVHVSKETSYQPVFSTASFKLEFRVTRQDLSRRHIFSLGSFLTKLSTCVWCSGNNIIW